MNSLSTPDRAFELRFESLVDTGRVCTFPCDAGGHVNMDALSEQARNNYLYARAVVGCEFSKPKVQTCTAF